VLRIGDLLADAPAIEGLKLFLASTVEDFTSESTVADRKKRCEAVKASPEVFSRCAVAVNEKKIESRRARATSWPRSGDEG